MDFLANRKVPHDFFTDKAKSLPPAYLVFPYVLRDKYFSGVGKVGNCQTA
jgi:hypothetical protein